MLGPSAEGDSPMHLLQALASIWLEPRRPPERGKLLRWLVPSVNPSLGFAYRLLQSLPGWQEAALRSQPEPAQRAGRAAQAGSEEAAQAEAGSLGHPDVTLCCQRLPQKLMQPVQRRLQLQIAHRCWVALMLAWLLLQLQLWFVPIGASVGLLLPGLRALGVLARLGSQLGLAQRADWAAQAVPKEVGPTVATQHLVAGTLAGWGHLRVPMLPVKLLVSLLGRCPGLREGAG